jgi:hypothetical protein
MRSLNTRERPLWALCSDTLAIKASTIIAFRQLPGNRTYIFGIYQMDGATSRHDTIDRSADLTFGRIFFLMVKKWRALLIGALAGLVVAFGIIAMSIPKYTVSMIVAPVQVAGSSGSLGDTGGIGKAIGLAGALGGSADREAPFTYYQTELKSVAVAQEVIQKRPEIMRAIFLKYWDAATQSYRPATSVGGRLLGPIYRFFNIRTSATPDAVMLQKYIDGQVKVDTDRYDNGLTLSISTPNPDFGRALLQAINEAADNLLRQHAQDRALKMIDYLNLNLTSIPQIAVSNALAQLLLEQERLKALSQSGIPYAADVLDPASASSLPTSPKPILILPLGIIGGIAGAILIIVFLDAARSRRDDL